MPSLRAWRAIVASSRKDASSRLDDCVALGSSDAAFRTNPHLELVALSTMPLGERRRLVRDDALAREMWLLRPTGSSGLTLKLIGAGTARLLGELREGALLSEHFAAGNGTSARIVAKLVLDGVLEIETDAGFVSGPRAHAAVMSPRPAIRASHRLARLSHEALRLAQRIEARDPLDLAARLYAFNTLPETPRWRARLATPAAVRAFVGVGTDAPTRAALRRLWTRDAGRDRRSGWRWWIPKHAAPAPAASPRFKIYISPALDAFPEALAASIGVFAELGAPLFKIGIDASGLLRPDRFVVYVHQERDLRRMLAALCRVLAAYPAQGVPFTAAADRSGLVSWGVDPEPNAGLEWRRSESWRRWITNQLAASLFAAQRVPAAERVVDPWEFALDRLALDGVDTSTWARVERPQADATSPH